MDITLEILEAYHGDSLLIRYGTKKKVNILIDGGISRTYNRTLKNRIQTLIKSGENIDLLVMTHIDDDHIGGIISLFQDVDIDKGIIKRIWFNSGKVISSFLNSNSIINESRDIRLLMNDQTQVSVTQGQCLEDEIIKIGIQLLPILEQPEPFNIEGATLIVLSPNREGLEMLNESWEYETDTVTEVSSCKTDYDKSIEELVEKDVFKIDSSKVNKSSIAFLFEYMNKRVLMLGDSHPDVIVNSLEKLGYSKENKLKVDVIKVSHHGSSGNTNRRLLDIVICKNYIVSTNGSRHGLPNKKCLARIINSSVEDIIFHFNYDIAQDIFTEEEKEKYNFTCKHSLTMEV